MQRKRDAVYFEHFVVMLIIGISRILRLKPFVLRLRELEVHKENKLNTELK